MDAYKKTLKQLSCVPLGDFEKLPDNACVRAAFIIDTVQMKVSSKTQKKFAILGISDGIEKFELPIWTEMCEEKQAILRENGLVYALLQIERKENKIHLSCKFLEDLSTIDEAKMKMCDDLYDKLKAQSKNGEPKWKKEKEKVVTSAEKEHLVLRLDADKTALSHILSLKKLLRDHPGKSTLEIQFISGQKKLGTLSIDATWGVQADAAFLKKWESFKKPLEMQ